MNILENLLASFRKFFSGPPQPPPEKPFLQDISEFPDVEAEEFVLHWYAQKAPEGRSGDEYVFAAGDVVIWVEKALFEWHEKAFNTLRLIHEKYGSQISEVRMNASAYILVGGDSTNSWDTFLDNLRSLGFGISHPPIDQVDAGDRKIMRLGEIVFVHRSKSKD